MKQEQRDLDMENEHSFFWRGLISSVEEVDLSEKTILDFGCNCGGFLRLLHSLRPFKHGIGIDIAVKPIETARSRRGQLPIDYRVLDADLKLDGKIDVAFSNEVVFLLPDLREHARFIYSILRPAGAYYLALGCHTENPLWNGWKPMLARDTVLPVFDYSPEGIAKTFADESFSVAVRRLNYQGFVPVHLPDTYYPKITDMLDHYQSHKLIFRMEKKK